MEKNLFKSIAETLIGAALCTLFILAAFKIPTFFMLFALLSGLPLVFVCSRRGYVFGIIAFLLSLVIVFLRFNDIGATLLAGLIFPLPGLAFGISASLNVKYNKSLFITMAAVLLGIVVELLIANGDGNGIRNIVNQAFSGVASDFEQLMPTEEFRSITGGVSMSELTEYAASEVLKFVPAIVVLFSVIYGYCTAMAGIFVFNRASGKKYNYTKFNMISAPKSVCIITVIIITAGYFISEDSTVKLSLTNLAFISEGFIGICGLSLIDFWLSRKIRKSFLRALIYVGVFLFGFIILAILPTALIILGYADGFFNLRMKFKRGGDAN